MDICYIRIWEWDGNGNTVIFGINGVPSTECGGKVLPYCGSGCEEVLPTGNGSQVVLPS